MSQTPIPYLFMRGGTSRGPYFNRADLPQDLDQLAKVLVAALGSGHPLNIDGIGGGKAGTQKRTQYRPTTTAPSELEQMYAKYAKCARWTIMQQEAEWRHAAVQKYATKVCNV